MAGTVVGQPPRKRLRIDDDPFGAVGDYAGSFLIKSAVEFSGGYDTNPGRLAAAQGKPVYVIAPEFLAVSDWERHALVADLRGSFTGYGSNLAPNADGTPLSAPLDIDRPNFIGHIDGRLDVSRDTRLPGRGGCWSRPTIPAARTCRPASPDIRSTPRSAAPSASTRISTGCRFPAAPPSTAPTIPMSKLTDGTSTTQRRPQLQPVRRRRPRQLRSDAGPEAVRRGAGRQPRARRLMLDRNGYARNSTGGYVKGGSSLRILAAADRRNRRSATPRATMSTRGCNRLEGLLTSASLIWTATPLTTAKFYSDTHDRRDHAARHLRRADAHLYRSRSITTSAAG